MAISRRFRTLWLSDLHLGSRDCQAEQLLTLLHELQADTLYLVGDLFDLWALRRQLYWPASHQAVVARLLALAAAGTRIIYVPGNHDDALRPLAPGQLLGCELQLEAEHRTADGRRLLITHGDQFDSAVACGPLLNWLGDKSYDLLLWLNRHCNRWRQRFGLPYWSLASHVKQQVGQAQQAVQQYQQAASHAARSGGYDGIVCGHIHVPACSDDNGVLYLNCGDWVDSCSALAESHSGELQLLHWAKLQPQLAAMRVRAA